MVNNNTKDFVDGQDFVKHIDNKNSGGDRKDSSGQIKLRSDQKSDREPER